MPAHILITGVSSGIGLGLVKACLGRGDVVFGLGRKPPPDAAGMPNLRFAACDLSDFAAVPGALRGLLQGVARVDLAILNAGILGTIADLADTPLNALKRLMDVNVWANKVLLDALFSGWEVGQVVAISSGAAVSGARGWNGYSISKAALNMLMKLYAAERPDVHISALAPGLVDTGMQAQVRAMAPDPRFPSLDRLRKAAGTADMPDPDGAAPRILAAIQALRSRPSGGFHDLRSL